MGAAGSAAVPRQAAGPAPAPTKVGGSSSTQAGPPTKSSVLHRNVGGPLLLLVLLGVGGFLLYSRAQESDRRSRDYSPGPSSTAAPTGASSGNSEAAAGQYVVNTLQPLKDGQYVTYNVPPGHYRVRVTTGQDGIKARWVGVNCYASPSEQRVYEANCDPSEHVQFIVENPTTLGLGATEQAAITVVTR